MICPQCTSENRKSARFCKRCGAWLAKQTPAILDRIVGCTELKEQIGELIRTFHGAKRKRKSARSHLKMHILLAGEAGTGKTNFPALIAETLFNEGIIRQRDITVVPAIGFAGFMEKRDEQLDALRGGAVLFDDLHKLVAQSAGEGITELDHLLSFMDEAGENVVVFAAARPGTILGQCEQDPSIRSRFDLVLHLPPMDATAIADVCMRMLRTEGLTLAPATQHRLEAVCRHMVRTQQGGAANGHMAAGLAAAIVRAFFARTGDGSSRDMVHPDDIPGEAESMPTPDEVLRDLDDLIGLTHVKEQLRALAVQVQVERDRVERGLVASARMPAVHCVLTGNPGTGKSTLARRLGALFAAMGVIDRGHVVEVDAARLISQFQGETRKVVNEMCERAMGGVLFIDEAYAFAPPAGGGTNALGTEVIDALLKRMEDDRGRFIVVAAGYRDPMNRFLNANEGLRSRFTTILHIDDYMPPELVRIFESFAHQDGRMLSPAALTAVQRAMDARHAMRDEHFANARFVRTFYETACAGAARRIESIDPGRRTDTAYLTLEAADIPWDTPVTVSVDEVMKEIDRLAGIAPVKDELRTLASTLQVQRAREERGAAHKPFAEHFIFAGNPGTGKTTVARLLARVLKAIGALETGQLIEVTEKDLVGVVVGETKQKTNEVIGSAMGGVLFIDEAYTLVKSQKEHNFAREAMEQLLVRMENDRGKFCVVAAGYPAQMEEFLRFNPGMPSRFTTTIIFPDFSADELAAIFRGMAADAQMSLAPGTAETLRDVFSRMLERPGPDFANARTVRILFDRTLKAQARRLAPMLNAGTLSHEELSALTPGDIPS
jgi:SpoVK/Ycf46/Vps4 family AAA+-type ATPase